MILERIEEWLRQYYSSDEYYRSNVKDILINVTMEYWERINSELRSQRRSYHDIATSISRPPKPFDKSVSIALQYQGFNLLIVKGDYNFITPVILNAWSEIVFDPKYIEPTKRPFFDRGPRQG